MIPCTPVLAKHPPMLLRNVRPAPTPLIDGKRVRPVASLIDSVFTDDELDAAVEMAVVAPEADPAWPEIYPAVLAESCAYFASEILRGPKKAPYNGKFLLGRHHIEWDELIASHTRLNILAARDHGKCRPAGSMVQAADGRQVPVERWGGGKVIAFDEAAYRLVPAESTAARWVSKSPCYRIQTRTGRTDVIADRHRLRLADGWTYGRDLQVGQRVAVPRTLPTLADQRLASGQAWLLGLILGDGGLRGSSVGLTIDDPMLVDAATESAAELGWELTGGEGGQYRLSNRWGRVDSPAEWMRQWGLWGKLSTEKFVPQEALQLHVDEVAELLGGLLDADGHVNPHGGGAIEFYSTSEQLARATLHLLTRLGVVAVLSPKRGRYRGEVHWSWRVTIRGESILRFARQVTLRGGKVSALRELASLQEQKKPCGSVDLVPQGGRWITRGKARRAGNPIADIEVLWDEIVEIEYVGEKDVYCIQVPGYETFVGEDFIHHNSFFFTFAYPIWKAGFNAPGSEGYIFSATDEQAKHFLSMIKAELEGNPRLQHLLPARRSLPGMWSQNQITLSNGSVIKARGFGTKVRGGHPSWLVCDDVLNDDDIYSDLIRQRNIDYFLSAISGMIHPTDQLIVVGTPMHEMDLYGVLADTEQVLKFAGDIDAEDLKGYVYECRKYPCKDPKTGELLFPERYDEKALKLKRIELKSAARFAREFECQPMSDEASLFPSTLFRQDGMRQPYVLGLPAAYWERMGCMRYTGVDIALSATTGGDYFIIFTIAVDPQGNRWIANIQRHKGMPFSEQLNAILEENLLMKPEVIHIEANQAQRVWSDEIARTSDAPVKRFFTTGIGGRQPDNAWKKGATQVAVNKHHIDRGVPSLRLSLEHRKWRIPRGDAPSIEMTENWVKEMGCIGWIDGKVQSVGAHDDLVMACLTPGQLVTTMGGMVPIEDIAVGDKVLTHRGRWRRVTETMSRPYDGTLHSIKPSGIPKPIRVTDDHPIWAAPTIAGLRSDNWRIRPGQWDWSSPSEMKAGRKLEGSYVLGPAVNEMDSPEPLDCALAVVGRRAPGFGKWRIEDDSLWWRKDRRSRRYFEFDGLDAGLFVGLYLAEGSVGANGAQVQFALHRRETYIVDFLRSFVEYQFGAPVWESFDDGQGMVACFGSVIANRLLRGIGKHRDKAMPWGWIQAPEPFLAGVLRGWLVGDGSRHGNKLRGVSCSRNLIEQMRLIAIRLGLRVSMCPFSNDEPAWQLDLEEEGTHLLLKNQTRMEDLRWGKWEAPKRRSNGRTFPMRQELGHRLSSVERIEYVGPVYNLEVEEDESYCVEGIAVHNCWMADTAARMGAVDLDFIVHVPISSPDILASPVVSDMEMPEHDHLVAERRVLAAIQQGTRAEVTADAYEGRVRAAMHRYAADNIDQGNDTRAIRALQEIKRLDAVLGFREADFSVAQAGGEGYVQGESAPSWAPQEGAPTLADIGAV